MHDFPPNLVTHPALGIFHAASVLSQGERKYGVGSLLELSQTRADHQEEFTLQLTNTS